MKEITYTKNELDGKCPFCGSWKIGKEGGFAWGPSGKTNFEIWKCDECKKGFKVRPEE
jgi:hypothetical protein